jgi:hypothetical protein
MWTGRGNDLYFCVECCRSMLDGLQADFIHVDAVRRLREVSQDGWYQQHTLVRKFVRQ